MRALVTGATGYIGRRLLTRLENPVVLTRHAERTRIALAEHNASVFAWQPRKEPPPAKAFEGVDAVVNLAGESVSEGRWTKAKKIGIRQSRVEGTRNLIKAIESLPVRPKTLVSVSAVGYYGDRGDEILTEDAPPDESFLSEVSMAWERESHKAADYGVRVVNPRIGIVLGPGGGPLARMATPFKFGLGAPLGSRDQWMPWVHLDDLVGMILFAIGHDELRGPFNATAPNPVTNREFTKALGRALGRPTFLPAVPGFVLKAMVGEFGGILLNSQRTSTEKIESAGYEFQHPDCQAALSASLRK